MAIEHDAIVDGERHEPKGIAAAAVDQVYTSNGAGSGAWKNQIGGGNTVTINAAADFPAPVSGVITLANNTTYLISGTVVITDTITPGTKSSIVSFEALSNELNYTGTGSMFKGVNKFFSVDNVSIRCANGTLNDWTDTTPKKNSVIEYTGVTFKQIKHCGLSTDIRQLRYFACVMEDIITTGHTYAGDIEQMFSGDSDFVNNSPTPVFNLGTAKFDLIWAIDYQVKLVNASGSFISGLVDSGNINTGGLGQLVIGLFLGPGTPLVNVSVDDVLWNFRDNNKIADTRPDALIFLLNNTTNTVITTVNTPVVILGTYTEHLASQFTTTAAGRITYNGVKPLTAPIAVTITASTVSGGDKDVTFYIAKNGSIIANSGISNNIKLANKNNTAIVWQETLVENDFIEIFCENNTDAVDILVEDLNLAIN